MDLLDVHLTEVAMQGHHQPWLSWAARHFPRGPGAGPVWSVSAGSAHLCAFCPGRSLRGPRDAEIQEPQRPQAGQGRSLRPGLRGTLASSCRFWPWLGLPRRTRPPCQAVPLPDAHEEQPQMPWQTGARS